MEILGRKDQLDQQELMESPPDQEKPDHQDQPDRQDQMDSQVHQVETEHRDPTELPVPTNQDHPDLLGHQDLQDQLDKMPLLQNHHQVQLDLQDHQEIMELLEHQAPREDQELTERRVPMLPTVHAHQELQESVETLLHLDRTQASHQAPSSEELDTNFPFLLPRFHFRIINEVLAEIFLHLNPRFSGIFICVSGNPSHWSPSHSLYLSIGNSLKQ